MNALEIKELPLLSKGSLCWGFFWRGLLITLASTICGGLIGVVVGIVSVVLGIPKQIGPVIAGITGLVSGVCFLYFYVRWLLSARIGEFKLLLVHADEQIQP